MLYQGENPKIQDTAKMDPDRQEERAHGLCSHHGSISLPPASRFQVKHINPQITTILFDTILHLQM